MIYECGKCWSIWRLQLLRCPRCGGVKTIVAKNTVHGGPTDQTFPPLDPREHGEQPTIEPVDAEEQRKQAEEEGRPELAAEPELEAVAVDEDGNLIVDEVEEDDDPEFVPTPPTFIKAEGGAEVEPGQKPPVDKSIDEVKAWVGDDYVRAERALSAERSGKNRAGLVGWLEKVAASK